MKTLLALFMAFAASTAALAQDIALPAPQTTGGMPIMEALAKRATGRVFGSRELTPQQLANLLWAGFGVNRPDGRRTAPSASNTQENEIYVLLKSGTFVYDAAQHLLRLVGAEDLRPLAGKEKEAAVTLLFVADLSRRSGGTTESKKNVACIDSGFISENIYLYCASEGLATGYRGGFNRQALTPKLKLRPEQEIIAAQSVGFPPP
jgi:nitroreductase